MAGQEAILLDGSIVSRSVLAEATFLEALRGSESSMTVLNAIDTFHGCRPRLIATTNGDQVELGGARSALSGGETVTLCRHDRASIFTAGKRKAPAAVGAKQFRLSCAPYGPHRQALRALINQHTSFCTIDRQ